MHKILASLGLVALAAQTLPATADEFTPALSKYLQEEISTWMNDPVLVEAVMAQNAAHGSLSQSEIDAMDQAWRAQVGDADSPVIGPVLTNPAADFLRARVSASGGVITEAFTMDAHGLNVAASDVTSDMWQGDEEKFTMTYPMGPGAVHLSDVEFDESTQSYQGQISVPLLHPETGEPVGALTVGINAEALM
ncbi:MAG: hypothetical protein RIG84_03655 [Roseovarius sp.]